MDNRNQSTDFGTEVPASSNNPLLVQSAIFGQYFMQKCNKLDS